MKRYIRYALLLLIVVATLGMGGCAKQGEMRPRKQKFQVVSLDKVKGSIGEGWRITLTIANNTASNMRITSGTLFLREDGRKVARLLLDGEVVLPRRRCSQVEVPLRITLSNPIAALSALNKIRKGEFRGLSVDYNITVSAFASHRIFEREGVSLLQLAQQFNLGLKN